IDTRGLVEIPEIQMYFRKSPRKDIRTEKALELSILDEMVGNLVGRRSQGRSRSLNNQHIASLTFQVEDYPPCFLIAPKLKRSTSIRKGLQLPIMEFRKILDDGFTDTEFRDATKTMKDKYVKREGR